MRLKLECPEDLEHAAALASWLGRPTVHDVVVLVPWLDPDERRRSAATIRRLFNDCGCAAGMAAFAVTAGVALGYQFAVGGWSWPSAGVGVLVAVAGGAVGKLLGLAWSRHRLRSLLLRMDGRGRPSMRHDP
ncbi:hypothetical protein [Streptomyces sp. Rer75]|uniref:hypothetical protein n=1 Tax=unclassified Streptomyces TaxID=2593676 RepID=UPI0015D00A08|nr:hypothetical protein [Streptomyces sp. Rer75]QLH25536.1 hypothetical protein HYQ63_37100 [Streptomyces sp. Rer75]